MRERYREFLRRSLKEKDREEEEQLRAPPVPLYGLPPAFQGPRTIERYRIGAGGWGARGLDTDTVHYQLIHGSRQERLPRLLVVATSRHPQPPRQPTPLRHFLWQHVVAEILASKRRPRLRVGSISPLEQKDVGGAERPVVVPIDGAPRTFTLIEAGQAQVAELNLPDHMLQAPGWPIAGIELVTVTDLTPLDPLTHSQRRMAGHLDTCGRLPTPTVATTVFVRPLITDTVKLLKLAT